MKKVIEQDKCIKDSIIWNMAENYYKDKGTKAFTEGHVSDGITSNTAIANAYANIISEYLKDLQGFDNYPISSE